MAKSAQHPSAPCLSAFCAHRARNDSPFLASVVEHLNVPAGDIVVAEGAPHRDALSVAQGIAMSYKSLGDSRRQVIGFHLPGDLVTLPRPGAPAHVSVQAVTRLRLCRLDAAEVEHIRAAHPEVDRRLLEAAGGIIDALQDHVLLLGQKTADERVASFLVALGCRMDKSGDAVREVALPMRRADIADYLGVSTETVSRLLSRFKSSGVLDLPKPTKAYVSCRGRLSSLAGIRPATAE